MQRKDRIIQMVLGLAAVGLLVVAGLLHEQIRKESRATELSDERMEAAMAASPEKTLLTAMPGGLRVLAVNYLWIRSQTLHQDGRHYDAYQLARAICALQPTHPGVWAYQAWQMAWNISVTSKTPDGRWQWIYNGVKLLRDKAIPLNPKSLMLYKELAWIFFNKIGGQMDQMHWTYKSRWAGRMQYLLGAPHFCNLQHHTVEEETQVVINEFLPIARVADGKDPLTGQSLPLEKRLLDRNYAIQGRQWVQSGGALALMTDPAVMNYAGLFLDAGLCSGGAAKINEKPFPDKEAFEEALRQPGVFSEFRIASPKSLTLYRLDHEVFFREFLEAYNRWSLDSAVEVTRVLPPSPKTDGEEAISKLINDADNVNARKKILAFIRAQALWNEYRMDPVFMHRLMEKGVEYDGKTYSLPLDWRHAMPHALYWAAMGVEVCRPDDPKGVVTLNNNRNILNALKSLTATGVVNLRRTGDVEYPLYYESPDFRYIAPTVAQHEKFIEDIFAWRKANLPPEKWKTRDDSVLRAGFVNYLIECINMLVADGRIKTAQMYYDKIRNEYKGVGLNAYKTPELVEEFVVNNIRKDGNLRMEVMLELLQFTFKRAYIARGLGRHEKEFQRRWYFAKKLYDDYMKNAVERMKLQSTFEDMAGSMLSNLLVQPRIFGLALTPEQRSSIYMSMTDKPKVQAWVYVRIERFLKGLAQDAGMDPAKAFPPPENIESYRKKMEEKPPPKPPAG